MTKQTDLKKKKDHKAVLLGIAGGHASFCLSLYNIKAFALSDPLIRHTWDIVTLQHPLITELTYRADLPKLADALAAEADASLIGFSCYMWNMKYARQLADDIRARNPEVKVVMGGPEISREWIEAGKYDELNADYLIYGEGERPFQELLRVMHGDCGPDEVKGLAYRHEGRWILNERQIPVSNLQELPSPFLRGCVDDEVLSREDMQASIETQRGCSLRCSYCIYHKDMPRIAYGNVERVLDEVEYVVNKGVKRIRFVDANFSSDLAHSKAIMRGLIERNIEATIMAELIPGFIDEELADLFEEYNALWRWNYITLGIGVQSINLDVLKRMRRKIKVEKFDRTFDLISTRGIYAKIDIILGLPGEDIASIARTQEYMLEKLKGSRAHLLCCHTMRGLPGTELLEIAEQFDMRFSSEREPHELMESPILPRSDMVRVLRRTAVTFRIINPGFSKSHEVRRTFYETVSKLKCSNLEVIDQLIAIMMRELPQDSWFVQDDFPFAETWWWERSAVEVTDEMLMRWFEAVCLRSGVPLH